MVLRIAACIISLSVLGAAAHSQQPPRFRVSVDMVAIDAVVTDREGGVVRDLTADDFEVLQDGRRQKVVFAQFIPIEPVTTDAGRASDERLRSDVPPIPARIRRENIQRTIAIVIDDLGLSFESIYYAKRALHSFIDTGLAPSDLVAILRTGRSATALQAFTTDRRVLHSIVDILQWNGLSRRGVGALEAAANSGRPFELSPPSPGAGSSSSQAVVGDFRALDPLRDSMSEAGTLGALNLAVQGTRDLPGRKAIVFVTDGFSLNSSAPREKAQPDTRVRDALDKVIDQAARAGVVIYTLDARGLQTAGASAEDAGLSGRQERMRLLFESQESITYLAEQTGGFAVISNNDLAHGLRLILEDVRDYYIVGYEPDSATFKRSNSQPRLHQVTVKVLRPGLRVRTTKEFIGVSDVEPNGGEAPAWQLVRAAISPFAASDILLRATALPGFSPQHGMFVRTLLHIDARAFSFVETANGRRAASADVVGIVFNEDAAEVAHLSTGFEVALKDETVDEALREGLVYTLRIPIPHAGGYQLRFAIRDRASGALGSAGEFVEMPDILGERFALSGLVLTKDNETTAPLSLDSDRLAVSPDEALRVYTPGARLSYAYEIYNAGKEVHVAASVLCGTQEVITVLPVSLSRPSGGERRFVAAGTLRLGESLPPGSYLLQVSASTPDKHHGRKFRTATQRIDFEIK